MNKAIIDCESGEITEVDLTQEEISQIENYRIEQEKPKPPNIEDQVRLIQSALDDLLLGGM